MLSFVSHLALLNCLYNAVCHMLICMKGWGDGRAKVTHVLAGLLSFPVVPTFPKAQNSPSDLQSQLGTNQLRPH